MEKQFEKAIERLKKINWENIGNDQRISNALLVQEYLRRAAVFAKTYSLDGMLIHLDAAQACGKDIQLDLIKLFSNSLLLNNTFYKMIVTFYLKWAILCDKEELAALKFCDLYEPLIKLFERGGTFRLHHGDIIVSNCAIPPASIEYWAGRKVNDISDNGLEKWANS